METNFTNLAIPAFISGILTFLAPCTLPFVPGYLAFIGGVSAADLRDAARARYVRARVLFNSVFYVLGFSAVFIALGSFFGFGGSALAEFRIPLSQVGGLFIIFFGLYLTGVFSRIRLLDKLFRGQPLPFGRALVPGNPTSSFLFGIIFALGWSPCIGPILGSILLLASASTSAGIGALLLGIFSLGLAVPFVLIAIFIGSASGLLMKIAQHLRIVSIVGGLFIIFLGVLIATNNMGVWVSWFFKIFSFISYDKLLNYM